MYSCSMKIGGIFRFVGVIQWCFNSTISLQALTSLGLEDLYSGGTRMLNMLIIMSTSSWKNQVNLLSTQKSAQRSTSA
jgi:hypothetical protein